MSDSLAKVEMMTTNKIGATTSPHKFALLLSIAKLYDQNPNRDNRFNLDNNLEELFITSIKDLVPTYNTHNAFIEYPFYHLQHEGFWQLKIKSGQKSRFSSIESSPNKRFTKRRPNETVQYITLSPKFDTFLRDRKNREVLS